MERESYQEDDDVFLSQQWKSPRLHTAPVLDYNKKEEDPEESEMIDINQLEFPTKRKLPGKTDSGPSSPHWMTPTSTHTTVTSDWQGDQSNFQHSNTVPSYNTLLHRPQFVCAGNKDSYCYLKHFENYTKYFPPSDKYTLCNIDTGVYKPQAENNCNTVHLHRPDQWIYPLHPPLPAKIECSPVSNYSGSDSNMSSNYMQYMIPPHPEILTKNTTVLEDIIV